MSKNEEEKDKKPYKSPLSDETIKNAQRLTTTSIGSILFALLNIDINKIPDASWLNASSLSYNEVTLLLNALLFFYLCYYILCIKQEKTTFEKNQKPIIEEFSPITNFIENCEKHYRDIRAKYKGFERAAEKLRAELPELKEELENLDPPYDGIQTPQRMSKLRASIRQCNSHLLAIQNNSDNINLRLENNHPAMNQKAMNKELKGLNKQIAKAVKRRKNIYSHENFWTQLRTKTVMYTPLALATFSIFMAAARQFNT